jgi:UrcA family protein
MLALALFVLCGLVSNVTVAEPGGSRQVTVRGTVSLAGLDVLTPEGRLIAKWRIQQMAQTLCLQIVDVDNYDTASCVRRSVTDAHQRLDAVIRARLAERAAHAVASADKR